MAGISPKTLQDLANTLQCMSEGRIDRDTATILGLSEDGVGDRVKTIFNVLYKHPNTIGNKRALSVSMAIRSGLIKGPTPLKKGLRLTPKETRLLSLLAEGKSDEQIKKIIGAASVLSVRSAFCHFLTKHGVHSRIHLMALAIVHDLI